MHTLPVLAVAMAAIVLLTEAQNLQQQPINAVVPKPSKDFWPGPGALPPRPKSMGNFLFPPPMMNFRPGMNTRFPPFMMPRKTQKGMFGGNSLLPMMFATNVIDEEMLPFMLMSGMGM